MLLESGRNDMGPEIRTISVADRKEGRTIARK